MTALCSGIPGLALTDMAEAQQAPAAVPAEAASWNMKQGRPKLSERRFRSVAVEEFFDRAQGADR